MGADPGRLPTPAASSSAASSSAPTGRGADEEAAAATVPVQPGTTSGTAEAEAAAGAATGAAATRQQPEPEASAGAGRRAQAAQATQATRTGSASAATAPDASASASAAASASASGEASGEGAGRGDGRGDGEPPSGNPKKPLLAAAGLAGVVLLAVPLLIWATNDSDKKTDTTSVVAESDTILDDQALNAPPEDYAPASPTAKPTTAKPSVKAKAKALPPPEPLSPPSPSPTAEKSAPVKKAPKKKAVVEAKPPANTASLAVMKLATQNAGRHICYRAYVKGIGWQAPVCDGAEAGTQGQNRPITALNIAVSSTNGVNATPWTMGEGYKAPWKGASDGGDLYIGVASSSAPALGGFAINIGLPLVCENAFVTDRGWLGLKCDNPGGENLIFAGTLEKTLALQAIRLTV
ncbi:hypothetical protein OG349_31840 [Streptomyces sp. NBC_01317]|uniref:hypothetical protein n=1 Tax=Streptomyces sp. NBC_01317 TaxID=2903822 RepID=UPI002E11268B|nr:hypothetical protein OG349_31840 [Streptomyces sp. NBC_01317]